VVVVIPAHDEAALIGETLEALAAQTRLADEVMVIADRCGDLTSQIAVAHNVTARLTIRNSDNKAGALNQALDYLLPRLSDNDAILMMDADTSLSQTFISEATRRLREPKGQRALVGAVGGIFLGYPLHGFLAHMQNNEYVRYARELDRRKGRADVLTGTATLFSARALRAVARARSTGQLPSGTGIYGIDSLTEDNELTLAMKHLGYFCVSPKACTAGTELMPTTRRLFNQRLRWQRGAVENLLAYGMTPQTLPYILRQLLTYCGVAFVPFFFTTLLVTLFVRGSIGWSWFWVYVTAFVAVERIWSVKRGGWRSVVLAGFVLPEIIFDLFLHGVYVTALAHRYPRPRELGFHCTGRVRREGIALAAVVVSLQSAPLRHDVAYRRRRACGWVFSHRGGVGRDRSPRSCRSGNGRFALQWSGPVWCPVGHRGTSQHASLRCGEPTGFWRAGRAR
jgi:cellulose synthase/poly-beta-1,6-N-acetylglucosamine synthase-like glycosyltransferase